MKGRRLKRRKEEREEGREKGNMPNKKEQMNGGRWKQ